MVYLVMYLVLLMVQAGRVGYSRIQWRLTRHMWVVGGRT